MFYFFRAPRQILTLLAIIPAVFLILKVYKEDRLERESPSMILSLIFFGILSTFIAMILERIGESLLLHFAAPNTLKYNIILYFLIVGVAEEGAKYLLLRFRTWKSIEFNCQFDGVVYAVTVSLGFALWENLSYVFRSAFMGQGVSTALLRAVTAIPGHASFGVFMGIWYGISKKYSNRGESGKAAIATVLSLVIPILLHGLYDTLASYEYENGWISVLIFIAFILLLFFSSWKMIKKGGEEDHYI